MSHKITLSELEKTLFPEYYPYYKRNFQEDLRYLKHKREYDETAYSNISFKLKVLKLSLNVADKNVRKALNHLFNIQVENFYDWQKSYNWYELKAFLLLFMLFSDAKSFKELERAIKKPHNKYLFHKYLPKKNKPIDLDV